MRPLLPSKQASHGLLQSKGKMIWHVCRTSSTQITHALHPGVCMCIHESDVLLVLPDLRTETGACRSVDADLCTFCASMEYAQSLQTCACRACMPQSANRPEGSGRPLHTLRACLSHLCMRSCVCKGTSHVSKVERYRATQSSEDNCANSSKSAKHWRVLASIRVQ